MCAFISTFQAVYLAIYLHKCWVLIDMDRKMLNASTEHYFWNI